MYLNNQSSEIVALETQTKLTESDQWRRFIPNEPSLTFLKDDSDRSVTYGLQLNVAFPGKAFAFTQLDSALAHKQRHEELARKAELATLVTQAYVDCAAAQATEQIREKSSNDLEAFSHSLKARRGAIRTEKLSLELEVRQSRRDWRSARDNRDLRCKKLKDLISDSKGEEFKLRLPEDLDVSIIQQLGETTPDQNRSLAAIEVAEANLSLSNWAQMPDLTLSYGQRRLLDAPDESTKRVFPQYGFSITLPLLFPFHERVEAKRAKSQAVVERSEAQTQLLQQSADRLEALHTYLRSKSDLSELRLKDLPLGQALLESAYSAYRAGQIGYADMVMSRKTLIELQLKDIELRSTIIAARLKCLNHCEVE